MPDQPQEITIDAPEDKDINLITAGIHHVPTLQGTHPLIQGDAPPTIITDIEEAQGQVPVDIPPFGTYATSSQVNYTDSSNEKGGNSLKGSKPKDFNRSRKESENFWDDFEMHWKINRKNNTMKEPYSWALMATSFMKGEKVRDWVRAQRKLLQE